MPHLHSGLPQQGQGNLSQGVLRVVHHFLDPGIDDHLGADEAGTEGRVERPASERDAVVGSLGDRIFLAVGAEALVEPRPSLCEGIATGASTLVAVTGTARRPVVSGRYDPAVPGDHCTHLAFHAVAARGDHASNAHEILVPTRPLKVQ